MTTTALIYLPEVDEETTVSGTERAADTVSDSAK